MLVTVTQCVFSMTQSFVVAVVAERGDFSEWKLRFDISLLAILYTVLLAIHIAVASRDIYMVQDRSRTDLCCVVNAGVCGNGRVLLPPGMVYGDERPRLSGHVQPALLRLHHILLVLLPRRDRSPWQVIDS